jgi:surfactin synthase thioesterase subunit
MAGRFALHLFDGGHFFLHEHLPEVLDIVTAAPAAKEATNGR